MKWKYILRSFAIMSFIFGAVIAYGGNIEVSAKWFLYSSIFFILESIDDIKEKLDRF